MAKIPKYSSRKARRKEKYNIMIDAGFDADTARYYRDSSLERIASKIKESKKIKAPKKEKYVYKISRGYGKTPTESKVISRQKPAELLKKAEEKKTHGMNYTLGSEYVYEDGTVGKRYMTGVKYAYIVSYNSKTEDGEIIEGHQTVVATVAKKPKYQIIDKVIENFELDSEWRYADKGRIIISSIKIEYCLINDDPIPVKPTYKKWKSKKTKK